MGRGGGERRDGGKEEHVIVWMQQEEVQDVEYQPGTWNIKAEATSSKHH